MSGALFADPAVPDQLARGIDLRRCDCADLIADLGDGCADLVIADPPWSYDDRPGATATKAQDHYACLTTPQIRRHVDAAARLSNRLALWLTGPFVPVWLAEPSAWGQATTMGVWAKSGEGDVGHAGIGYHWTGCMEPVLLYARTGCYTDRAAFLRNTWVESPGEHSRKPVAWMVQWLRRWVPPGGLVVDLYAGLGSVPEAVLLAGEGRQYIGAEIDPERHRRALGLLAQVRP